MDVPPPTTRTNSVPAGTIGQRLSRTMSAGIRQALTWSESTGYRWLRIVLCIILLVLVPKGYVEFEKSLVGGRAIDFPYESAVAAGTNSSSQCRDRILHLDFEDAIEEGNYRVENDMVYVSYYLPLTPFISNLDTARQQRNDDEEKERPKVLD